MANYFPPTPVYPKSYDSDYTLFLVYNTSETITTEENFPWADEISIKPVPKDKNEIWAPNGFANIEGELFYYDDVEHHYYDQSDETSKRINKLKRCSRNLGGTHTKHNLAGSEVRGFVIAEHHNQIVDAILKVENFVGENFSTDTSTLDWRIRHLQQLPIIFDDFTCPDVTFDFYTVSSNPATGILVQYFVTINGTFTNYRLDFGDGEFTTSSTSGTHRYAPNSIIDPILTISNSKCTIVQSPIERILATEPVAVTTPPTFEIPVPTVPEIPKCNFPNPCVPSNLPQIPPIVFPCLDISSIASTILSVVISEINTLPSIITFGPLPNIPSLINFGPMPSIPSKVYFGPIPGGGIPSKIYFVLPPIPLPTKIYFDPIYIPTKIYFDPMPNPIPSRIVFGPAPTIPTKINFGPAPKIPTKIEFGPAPTIPTKIAFGPAPTVPTKIEFGPVSKLPTKIEFGPAPTLPTKIVFGTAPSIPTKIVFGPAPSIPTKIVFGPAPSIPTKIEFGPAPFIPTKISFGPAPFIPTEILFGPAPTIPTEIVFGPAPFIPTKIEFGPAPTINVTWGSPPTVSCVVTVSCPSASPTPFRASSDILTDGLDPIEIQSNDMGIPSEIMLVVPEIPDIRVIHDIPQIIRIEAPSIPDVKIIGPEIPIPQEIRVTANNIPSTIELVSYNLPTSIKLDVSDLPKAIKLEVPENLPSIKIDATGIPTTIQVVGIPSTIELVGAPSEIKLVMPEKPEIELVYKGAPIDVKINLDISRLTGDNDNAQCVAIVPCTPK